MVIDCESCAVRLRVRGVRHRPCCSGCRLARPTCHSTHRSGRRSMCLPSKGSCRGCGWWSAAPLKRPMMCTERNKIVTSGDETVFHNTVG